MKLRRRHKIEPEIPLSSMADLAMLLLVFFVICGKATTRSAVPIEPPVSLTADPVDRGMPVMVTVSAAGEIYLEGRLIDGEELLAELEAILQNRTDRQSRTVQLEIDRRTRYRDYLVVVDAVNRVKGYLELRVKQ